MLWHSLLTCSVSFGQNGKSTYLTYGKAEKKKKKKKRAIAGVRNRVSCLEGKNAATAPQSRAILQQISLYKGTRYDGETARAPRGGGRCRAPRPPPSPRSVHACVSNVCPRRVHSNTQRPRPPAGRCAVDRASLTGALRGAPRGLRALARSGGRRKRCGPSRQRVEDLAGRADAASWRQIKIQ